MIRREVDPRAGAGRGQMERLKVEFRSQRRRGFPLVARQRCRMEGCHARVRFFSLALRRWIWLLTGNEHKRPPAPSAGVAGARSAGGIGAATWAFKVILYHRMGSGIRHFQGRAVDEGESVPVPLRYFAGWTLLGWVLFRSFTKEEALRLDDSRSGSLVEGGGVSATGRHLVWRRSVCGQKDTVAKWLPHACTSANRQHTTQVDPRVSI